MPFAAVTKSTTCSQSKKGPKLPEGAPEVIEKTNKTTRKKAENIKLKQFTDELMSSDWHPYSARPSRDVYGFYVIFRWFNKEKWWVPLYVGSGKVQVKLDHHFRGKEHSAISKYLSSFPKDARHLIWTKWAKDPFYPDEAFTVAEVMREIAINYNDDQMPSFNDEDDAHDKPLPENFSIVPDWKPAKSSKSKKRQSTTKTVK